MRPESRPWFCGIQSVGGTQQVPLGGHLGPATRVLGHVRQGCRRTGVLESWAQDRGSPGLFGNGPRAPSRRPAVDPRYRPDPANAHGPACPTLCGSTWAVRAAHTSHLPRRPVSCSRDQMLWILPACSGWLLVLPQAHWCFSMSVSYTRPAATGAAASGRDATPRGDGLAPRRPAGRILRAKPRASTGGRVSPRHRGEAESGTRTCVSAPHLPGGPSRQHPGTGGGQEEE